MADFALEKNLVWDYIALLDSLDDTETLKLPAPKEKLKEALNTALKNALIKGNDFQILKLQRGLWYLEKFTP